MRWRETISPVRDEPIRAERERNLSKNCDAANRQISVASVVGAKFLRFAASRVRPLI